MKQLSNKIIFVFLLAVGLSLVPAYKADAHWVLVEVADGGGGGGGGGGGNNPPSNNISNINLIVQLNKENYNPNEQIRVTATASYAVCSNTAVNIEVYGHIDQESSQIILYKNTVGGDQVNNTQTYTAPNSVGAHIFYGQVEVYKTSNPYISITQDGGDGSFNYDGQPFILNQVFYRYDGGSSFTRVSDGEEFPFSYFSDENGEIHIKIALDVEGDIMRNFSATFVPGVVTTQLLGSTTFSIPFTVVAPTSKSMTIKVLKENGDEVRQGAGNVTSQGVPSGTELLIRYTPSGLSFPFTCYEPPVSSEYPNGYPRVFSSQYEVTNYKGFTVIPSKTTNYSVTCEESTSITPPNITPPNITPPTNTIDLSSSSGFVSINGVYFTYLPTYKGGKGTLTVAWNSNASSCSFTDPYDNYSKNTGSSGSQVVPRVDANYALKCGTAERSIAVRDY